MGFVEDIFYIFAAFFFGVITVLICIISFYWIKILRDIARIISTLKKTGSALKEKIEGISGILIGIASIIEKIAKGYYKKKKSKKRESK